MPPNSTAQLLITMARPIKIKINVTRILKEYIFEGKNGKYLNLVAWPKTISKPWLVQLTALIN